jgi:hypothetical protein
MEKREEQGPRGSGRPCPKDSKSSRKECFTCNNMMSFVRRWRLKSGWGMVLFTGMTSWVFSCSLMLWAPRVTFIELHREQSEGGGWVGSQRGYNSGVWRAGYSLQGGATTVGKLRGKELLYPLFLSYWGKILEPSGTLSEVLWGQLLPGKHMKLLSFHCNVNLDLK